MKTINKNQIIKKVLFLGLFVLLLNNGNAQTYCGTPESSSNQFLSNQIKTMTSTQEEYHLRVYFHVIRNSDGIGGPSESQVLEAFNLLNDNYNPHNIFFHVKRDCNESFDDVIDYIDNDTHVPVIIPDQMFNINNHQDGIDIYFGGENSQIQFSVNNNGEGGIADGVGENSAFIVAGTREGNPPSFYTVESNIVSHEMGHVLFLWHTHHGSPCSTWSFLPDPPCAEFANGTNGEDCGDEVADTPADPFLNFDVTLNCEFLPQYMCQVYDPNNDIYAPNTALIMSYTNPHCSSEITPGQGERMRCSIEILPHLQNCIIDNVNISSNTIWNADLDISESITVENGAELEISAQIRFAEDAKLIIEPGGKVIINGGTLTNLCNDLWPGVEIQGNGLLSQSPNSNQGWLNMINNAEINNATIGVTVGGNISELRGGIITAYGSNFRNNERDVYFKPYQNFNSDNDPIYNKSKFQQCNFIVDNQVGNTTTLENRCRVQINWVDGIMFKGCHFGIEGNALNIYDYSQRGAGILSYIAGYRVIRHCSGGEQQDGTCDGTETKSTFNNLKYGIFSIGGDLLKTFKVNDAVFNNNQYGIHAINIDNLSLIRNEFIVNPVAPGIVSAGYYYGTYLRGCTGYEVEQNEFYTTAGNFRTIGVAIRDSDDDPNRIYYNEFHDLYIGTTTQGDNQVNENFLEGLQVLCGQYENNQYDITCANNSKIAFYQGTNVGADEEKYSAANQFLTNIYDCPNNNMIHLSDNSQQFNYYYKDGEHPFGDSNTQSCWYNAINPINPYLLKYFGTNEGIPFFGRDTECLSGLTYGGPTKDEKKLKVIEKRNEVNAISNAVAQMEDGGNTDILLANINNPNSSSYSVRNALINYCPYLSDAVLIELINRTPTLGQWDLTELLINNSPLSFSVLTAYYDKEPLTSFYHTILLNYQDGESTLLNLKREIKDDRAIKGDAQSDFVRMMTLHKEEAPELDEIKELLDQDETNIAIKTKYAIAIQEGNETDAQELLSMYVPTSDDDAWSEFQELMLEIRLNGNPQDLTSNQISTLESFITNNKKEAHVAKALLWMATGIEYAEDLEFPDEDKSFAGNKPKTLPTVELPELNVFPNPATNEVFFTFELPEDMKNTFIRIYSFDGKLVHEEDLTGRKGMYRVDISNLALGSYLSEILVDDIQILNTKFVKH